MGQIQIHRTYRSPLLKLITRKKFLGEWVDTERICAVANSRGVNTPPSRDSEMPVCGLRGTRAFTWKKISSNLVFVMMPTGRPTRPDRDGGVTGSGRSKGSRLRFKLSESRRSKLEAGLQLSDWNAPAGGGAKETIGGPSSESTARPSSKRLGGP